MDPYRFIRPLLFQLPAETAHHLTFKLLKTGMSVPGFKNMLAVKGKANRKPIEFGGLKFPNPVGLAAGLDKDARVFNEMLALGFGFVEVGTVTPRPQKGNPKPRLFRLPKDQALINRMGFNNDGASAVAKRLADKKVSGIIGGNIGKNKDTPNEIAHEDYLRVFNELVAYVDYFTVNVSSPNTPDLRELQDKSSLEKIINTLQDANQSYKLPKPIFLKIAPDLNEGQLNDILELVQSVKIDGIIATNTTISRGNLLTSKEKIEKIGNGGLSGRPLTTKATNVLKYLKENFRGELPVMASGGVMSAKDAREKFDAGADLVQLYTGLVYKGPKLLKEILAFKN